MSQSKRRRVQPLRSLTAVLSTDVIGHVSGFCDVNSLLRLLRCSKLLARSRQSGVRICARVDMSIKRNLCTRMRLWVDHDDWEAALWLKNTGRVDMRKTVRNHFSGAELGLFGATEGDMIDLNMAHTTSRRVSEPVVSTQLMELRTRRHQPRIQFVGRRLLELILWNLPDPFTPLTRDIWVHPKKAIDGQGGRLIAGIMSQAQDALRRMSVFDVCYMWIAGHLERSRFSQVGDVSPQQ